MKKTVPEKANLILNLILLALCFITARVWYLSILQHDAKMEEARRPQKKTIIIPAERGTIRDRSNTLLAANKLKYRAALVYADIQEIPAIVYEKQPDGKSKKIFKRKEYIEQLAALLERELQVEKLYIEDLIYSKAVFLGRAPLIIKDEISESSYYRLKALEREWPGLCAEISSKRFYPLGKVGCDVIGYMGAISQSEYRKIMQDIVGLSEALSCHIEEESTPLPDNYNSWFEVEKKLKVLQEKAYTINDRIGKAGVEASFDQQLKGRIGKQFYLYDRKGTLLRALPGSREPISGERLRLSLSAELQRFAEELLIDNEARREGRSFRFDAETMKFEKLDEPWIKGGALVALDPNTGEVIALASYPRFDPTDFVPCQDPALKAARKERVQGYLENEAHIASLWNENEPLKRERMQGKIVFEEKLMITWKSFLRLALPHDDPLLAKLDAYGTIGHSLNLQKTVYKLCQETGLSEKEVINSAPEELARYFSDIKTAEDRLLFADLLRLLVPEELFSARASKAFSSLHLDDYKELICLYKRTEALLRKELKTAFRHTLFATWREKQQAAFLKTKRAEEKKRGLLARPYLDYLHREEERQFALFWQENKWKIVRKMLLAEDEKNPLAEAFSALAGALKNYDTEASLDLLKTMQSFEEMNSPLWGHYPHLRTFEGVKNKKSLAASFYPLTGFGYGRSYCFRQASQLGSLFKIVPAYTAMIENYENKKELNPLTIIDSYQKTGRSYTMGTFLDGKTIPRLYKGGRLPRSEHGNIGRINMVGALETSSNPYFSLLASEHISSPAKLLETASLFSFGKKTGIDIAGEISGRLPTDLDHNPTGLYSFAIGQHAFDCTPLQAAVMLSAVATGGHIMKPHVLKIKAGKQPSYNSETLFHRTRFPFQKSLETIGVDFPLLTASLPPLQESLVDQNNPSLLENIPMPKAVHNILAEGLEQVVVGRRGTAKSSKIHTFSSSSPVMEHYRKIERQFVGKTSTAQRVERLWPAKEGGAQMVKHVWFGGVFYEDEKHKKPELVVIVYLRYGDFGREAAPLATEVARYYRHLKQAPSTTP